MNIKDKVIMESYFEPTGRLLMSLGKDLVKDLPAALVELVKNSYDADATYVKITYKKEYDALRIIVEDDGHGMNYKTVIGAWMVPSTDYKLIKKKSPKGRIYQGRKGIGRYAVSILGNKLDLITVKDFIKTSASFDWNEFNSEKKLSEIPIIINTCETVDHSGTKLIITNEYNYGIIDAINYSDEQKIEKELSKLLSNDLINETDAKRIKNELSKIISNNKSNNSDVQRIKKELLKLLSNDVINEYDVQKIEKELSKLLSNIDDFRIEVCYENFYNNSSKNTCKIISQLEFDDAWHYKLVGKVNSDFNYKLVFSNFYTKEEKVFCSSFFNDKILNENVVSCGDVCIDYRVYDKDPWGTEVIMNFLNKNKNTNLSKSDIKNMLIDQSGISIFRSDFRIRPYGDKGFDWLNLDSKRVQNPSMAIGSEQINGRISIGSEEVSGLKEKSARDGLYENSNFYALQRVAGLALNILEKERYKYRQQKERKHNTEAIDRLFDFSSFNQSMEKAVVKAQRNLINAPEKTDEHIFFLGKEINNEIKKLEKEKEIEFLEVKENIAIYQKHTTLGNVICVVLHEGRKPLSWYTNKLPQMQRKLDKLLVRNEILKSGYKMLSEDVLKLKNEANRMSGFFKRLDPLVSNKRKKKKNINVSKEIKSLVEIFEGIMEERKIYVEYNLDEKIILNIVEEDLYMALTNIIDNAIFWLNYSENNEKNIKIKIYSNNGNAVIEIIDNGPGIPIEDIKENMLFLPGYSRKNTVQDENGTGLGLSIAGEAIQRNNGTLEVIESSVGAHFRITMDKVEC